MARIGVETFSTTLILGLWLTIPTVFAGETVLSTVLTSSAETKKDHTVLSRQSRSDYYDPRYYNGRQLLERLARYDQPRCGRCDDRYGDRDDFDRSSRDRYDDDRRISHRPTYGNRLDRNKNYDRDDDDDRRHNPDRRNGSEKKNGTNDDASDDNRDKRPYDDKDDDRKQNGGKRDRDRDRNRYDDRDRYRPDYYDRFLRDPNRERDPYRERDAYGYDEGYRERRPLFDRYPYADRFDDGYGGRYDGRYDGYYDRRPIYDDRGNGYDDAAHGRGRGPHDSFRPWDETYRGQSGWDAGGRGYYFASGRPEIGSAPAWNDRRDYASQYPRDYGRDQGYGGWQSVDRSVYGNRDPIDYRGSLSYPQTYGYRQDYDAAYRPTSSSGWQNVGERRPYRDQSSQLGKRTNYGQSGNTGSNNYGQTGDPGTNAYISSSTTPGTSYLYQRENEQISVEDSDTTTKPST